MAVRLSGAQSLKRTASLPDDELFTACGWARLSVDRNDYSCLFSLDDASSNWYLLETDVDGTTLTLVNPTGSPQTLALLTPGVDFFWAIGASGLGLDNAAYYRAAGANALSTIATGVNRGAFTPTGLYVGNDGFGEAWNGLVWDVKCWNRLLTPQELLRQSYSFKPLDRTAINFWWPLQRHDVVNDYSGNGRDPTVTGTLTTENPVKFSLPARRRRVLSTVSAAPSASPGVGNLIVSGLAPTLLRERAIAPLVGSVTTAGLAPALLKELTASPATAGLTLSGLAPTELKERAVQPATAALNLGGLTPNALGVDQIAPTVGLVQAVGLAPTLLTERAISPATGLAIVSGAAPTYQVPGEASIAPTAGPLTTQGLAPTLITEQIVQPSAQQIVLSGLVPTIDTGADASLNRGHVETGRRWHGRIGKYEGSVSEEVALSTAFPDEASSPFQPLGGAPDFKPLAAFPVGIERAPYVVPPELLAESRARIAKRKRRRREEELILLNLL